MITKGITRRSFLAYGAMTTVMAGLMPRAAFALCDSQIKADNKYLFADQPSLGPEISAPMIERQCCALHREVKLGGMPVDSAQYQNVRSLLQAEFASAGLPWDPGYEIGFTYQHYGVPDQTPYTEELLAYCRQAQHYLYDHLSNLFDGQVSWHRLAHNDVHTQSHRREFRGIVGRYTYYVMRAVVLNAPAEMDPPYLVSAWPLERAINYIVSGSKHSPVGGTVYVIPGTTSLIAPFSELLHLSLHAASQRYAAELADSMPKTDAKALAKIAGETTNEAAATLLATEFLTKQQCSSRVASVERVTRSMAKQYVNIPQSINFMKRVGVQEALNIFQDDPAEFMRRIS